MMDDFEMTSEGQASEPELKLRSYQQEMLDLSLQRNVIVAMDTGSGKTHVATFRIQAELERTSKMVWFVAPKVELSLQQHAAVSKHLPGYLVKTLLGSDGVDKWTDQKLWDATLKNVRVVVGTPAVLADALTHGFVHISQLSLLVFDEVHNCIGKSPMSRIMKDFYHPAKAMNGHVPHILGLSASPVISTKSASLQTLEANLNAIAVTPKHHRSELEIHVHPPKVTSVTYAQAPTYTAHEVPCYTALVHTLQSYDFLTDPYVIELQEMVEAGDSKGAQSLAKVQLKRKTWCTEQLLAIRRKSLAIQEQLGASAAEWYVTECRNQFVEGLACDVPIIHDTKEKERSHLAAILDALPWPNPDEIANNSVYMSSITPKARSLVDTLIQHSNSSSTTRALIFAEQRAVVLALALLLQSTPELASFYSFGTFIGTSTSDKRKTAVADLIDLKTQSQDLKSFRSDGRKNVIISTSVLEEGIDVSACNLVICFDPPKNLVAYVPRRGRARQQDSKYIMLMPEDQPKSVADRWTRLEAEMKEAYNDEQRHPGSQVPEDVFEDRAYRVESTGALLHFDNAKAHLYHFCQVSTNTSGFIDARPEFSTDKDGQDLWTASVTLPSFVHPSLRVAEGTQKWHSEDNAIKDAAFEAYLALHQAGLVNDNLLPLTRDYGPDPGQVHIDQPAVVSVSGLQSSWSRLCHLETESSTKWYASPCQLFREDGTLVVSMMVHLPVSDDVAQSIVLYWNESTTFTIEIGRPEQKDTNAMDSKILRDTTDRLLRSVYGSRMHNAVQDLPFFLSNEELLRLDHGEPMDALELLTDSKRPVDCGLIQVRGQAGRAYFLDEFVSADETSEMSVVATAFPKRRDFLHRLSGSHINNAAYTAKQTLPVAECTVDVLPAKYALIAAFVPSVLHRVDVALLAEHLQVNLLPCVHFSDRALIVEAISSPSAQEVSDYNRLEYLGDAILKFCTVLHVMAKHPTWPEGYLGLEKFRIVSNKVLAKAAMSAGLDKYIIMKPFTGTKWRPPYVSELLSADQSSTREMSSKVLADVMEALIGAAFVDGGLEKAYDCICALLSNEGWSPLPDCIARVVAETSQETHVNLGLLERLVGHTYRKPELLIEALTHASCPHSREGSSYERLEFLGDAVLDLIVVPKLFSHHRKPRHWDLHRMRDALVNGDYLAYCCMQLSIEEEILDVVSGNRSQFDVQQSTRTVHLHDFLRSGAQLMKRKRQCLEASEAHLFAIEHGIENDSQYPWPELIAFKPPKFLSDIIESTLGALFLDTGGDLAACEDFLDRLGVFNEMRRILDEHVETAYPKEQLGILADREQVQYICTTRVDDSISFECTVRIGIEDVATVGGSQSQGEAELRAAREAVSVLKRRPDMLQGRKNTKLDLAINLERTSGSTFLDAAEAGAEDAAHDV